METAAPIRTPRLASAVAFAATGSAAVVSLAVAPNADRHASSAFPFALVVLLGIAAGSLLARVVPRGPVLTVLGGLVCATAAWLFGQRDDLALRALLVFLFGIGLPPVESVPSIRNLRTDARTIPSAAWVAVGAVFVLDTVLLIARAEAALVALAAAGALAFSALTAFAERGRTRARRGRAITFGALLVVVTLFVTGYVGSETASASWFGGGVVHGPTGSHEVALTFDDGPNVTATEQIVHILDAHGVKGTFFEIGKAIDADPQITRAVFADGQLLGNHSYHHDQWRWLDPRYPELQRTQAAFQRAIGTCPVLYRPPHGDRTPFLANVVHDHHMHMIMWNDDTDDWTTSDAQAVARHILDKVKPGAIIDLHDGLDGKPNVDRSVVVRALPIILDGLRARGLTPVRLDVLLGTGAYQSC